MPDAQAEFPEVKPTVGPKTEQEVRFITVTTSEVDELITKTDSAHAPEDLRQRNLQKLKDTNPEEYERLNAINERRLKELAGLEAPTFQVTEEHLRHPGVMREVKKAAEDLPKLREALDRSQKWKERWNSLSKEEQWQIGERLLELTEGSGQWTKSERERVEKIKDVGYPELKKGRIVNLLSNMIGHLEERHEKLEHAVQINSTENVQREMEKLAQVRSSIEETSGGEKGPQEKPPESPPPTTPKGGFLGRIFGRK